MADSLIHRLERTQHDTSRLVTLLALSEHYLYKDPAKSIKYSQQALDIAHTHASYLTRSYLSLGKALWLNGELTPAQQHLEKGIVRATSERNHFMLGRFYSHLGGILFTKAEFDLASTSLDSAEVHTHRARDKKGQIRVFNSKAIIYGQKGSYDQAITCLRKSAQLCYELNLKKETAAVLNNLGDIYKDIGQLNEAYRTYRKALSFVDPSSENAFYSVVSMGMAQVLLDMYETGGEETKLDSAILLNTASLTFLEKSGLELGTAYGYINKGRISLFKELPGLAKQSFQKSLDLSEKQGANSIEHLAKRHLGEAYLAMGMSEEAIKYFGMSLSMTKEMKLVNEIKKNYLQLAKAYESVGKQDLALSYFKKYNRLKDSLFNAEKSRQLAELDIKYRSTEKEKENQKLRYAQDLNDASIREKNILFVTSVIVGGLLLILSIVLIRLVSHKEKANGLLLEQKLRVENHNRELGILNERITLQHKVISSKNLKLAKLNQEKDQLLSVITHDIRSPMILLQETLKMMNKAELSEKEVHSLTRDLAEKVSDTTHFIDNLLNWVVAQVQGIQVQPEKVDVNDLLGEVVSLLNELAAKKQIRITTDIELQKDIYLDSEMFKVVLRNLIANAIKFTPEQGEIIVKVRQESGKVEFTVIDNGVGMDEEIQANLFNLSRISMLGTDAEKGTGLGLLLTKNFVELMGGTITVSSKPHTGSTFYVSIPSSMEQVAIPKKTTPV
ncbi:MAG: tetratricopeptide repeat-containing sensor histidine kinase [Bacteroidota bacterium]